MLRCGSMRIMPPKRVLLLAFFLCMHGNAAYSEARQWPGATNGFLPNASMHPRPHCQQSVP